MRGRRGSVAVATSSSPTPSSAFGNSTLPWHGEGGRMTHHVCPSAAWSTYTQRDRSPHSPVCMHRARGSTGTRSVSIAALMSTWTYSWYSRRSAATSGNLKATRPRACVVRARSSAAAKSGGGWTVASTFDAALSTLRPVAARGPPRYFFPYSRRARERHDAWRSHSVHSGTCGTEGARLPRPRDRLGGSHPPKAHAAPQTRIHAWGSKPVGR
jgi:hypothetical protein